MSVSSPTNSAMFPAPASQLTRKNSELGRFAELIGVDDLLSTRFVGAFVILLFSLYRVLLLGMIRTSSTSCVMSGDCDKALEPIVPRLVVTAVFVVVVALVLRGRMSVVTAALVVAVICCLFAAVGQALFPQRTTSYEHFELRRLIANFTWPFLCVMVLSLSLELLRPWWIALITGLCLYDSLWFFAIGAIYGVGPSYWPLLRSPVEGWVRLGGVVMLSLGSAVVTTGLFAVLLHFTRPSGQKTRVSGPLASLCASTYFTGAVHASPVAAAATSPTKGIQENVAGLLCYLFGWVSGIIFLQVDKRPFVKFHAAQSIVVLGSLHAIHFVLRFTHFFLFSFGFHALLELVGFVLWIVLMIKAFQHEMFRVPIAAGIADSFMK